MRSVKYFTIILLFMSVVVNSIVQAKPAHTVRAEESSVSEEVNTASGEGTISKEDIQTLEDEIYQKVVESINSDEYFVENIEVRHISKEYLEEMAYNSQSNVYFGYNLSELDAQFEGERYVFTVGDDGKTIVKPFEHASDKFETILRNVATAGGVIIVCVTVSAVTAASAPAVSVIFAAAATGATKGAIGGLAVGAVDGVVTGFKTKDLGKALEAAAVSGSEGMKWGAISGALIGGGAKWSSLKGATRGGLTLNEVAKAQKELKYSTEVLKNMRSLDELNVYRKAELTEQLVDGKRALTRSIDLNYAGSDGVTNAQRMRQGLAALEPGTNQPYELHHTGQKADGALAILTKSEHMQGGNNQILHTSTTSEIDRAAFDKVRQAFWKALLEQMEKGA